MIGMIITGFIVLSTITFIGIAIWLDIVNFFSILFIVLAIIEYLILYVVGKRLSDIEQDKLDERLREKKDLAYCYRRVNEILKSMTNGQTLNWDGGFSRISRVVEMKDNHNQIRIFRSLSGSFSGTGQTAIVIFDVTKETIHDFIADPNVDILADPFFKFEPFKSASSMQQTDPRLWDKRYKRGKYRPSGFGLTISPTIDDYDDGDSSPQPPASPSENDVNKMLNNG